MPISPPRGQPRWSWVHEALEDECRRRGVAGSDILLMFMLKSLRPERFRERSSIDVNQTPAFDYRGMPIEEIRHRLAELRREQDGTALALPPPDAEAGPS